MAEPSQKHVDDRLDAIRGRCEAIRSHANPCDCGCGRDAGVYQTGKDAGKPKRYLKGHHRRDAGATRPPCVEVGKTYGRLTVLVEDGRDKWGSRTFRCRCSCGEVMDGVLGGSLKNGNTKSCGCLSRELTAQRCRERAIHSYSVGRGTPAYRTWLAMRNRCHSPSHPGYHHYGGRGIVVCERWDNFENFLADMGERPEWASGGIDRIDPNGNYEPGNCRWATRSEQQCNKRVAA